MVSDVQRASRPLLAILPPGRAPSAICISLRPSRKSDMGFTSKDDTSESDTVNPGSVRLSMPRRRGELGTCSWSRSTRPALSNRSVEVRLGPVAYRTTFGMTNPKVPGSNSAAALTDAKFPRNHDSVSTNHRVNPSVICNGRLRVRTRPITSRRAPTPGDCLVGRVQHLGLLCGRDRGRS